MARKKAVRITYVQDRRGWILNVQSSDPQLRAELMERLKAAQARGLEVINAADPFAIFVKPRKAKAKKAAPVGGQDG